jgi:hypothetical protein
MVDTPVIRIAGFDNKISTKLWLTPGPAIWFVDEHVERATFGRDAVVYGGGVWRACCL